MQSAEEDTVPCNDSQAQKKGFSWSAIWVEFVNVTYLKATLLIHGLREHLALPWRYQFSFT